MYNDYPEKYPNSQFAVPTATEVCILPHTPLAGSRLRRLTLL